MEPLNAILARIETITGPAIGYTNDTRVWPPDEADTSNIAVFKRQLVARCLATLDAGKACLSGASKYFRSPLYENECEQIEALLADDPEQREYYELIHYALTASMFLDERFREPA